MKQEVLDEMNVLLNGGYGSRALMMLGLWETQDMR